MRGEWNHNIHYHDGVLAALPRPCAHALDVGCGEGLLARELATLADEVTAIDLSAEVVAVAQARTGPHTRVKYLAGDVMTHPFPLGSFDAITAVATLHHLPLRPALLRLCDLLQPGGVLAIVGLYRMHGWRDYAMAPVGRTLSLALRHLRPWQTMNAPMSEPSETFYEIRDAAAEVLPGAQLHRRLLFRYTLIWRKPTESAS